ILKTQSVVVLAVKLKKNANKLAKRTSQTLLGCVDVMKLGYVSRIHPGDHLNHVIFSVQGDCVATMHKTLLRFK
ncbi:hypothetical protein KI387_027474, partial [Taxus chinensis]